VWWFISPFRNYIALAYYEDPFGKDRIPSSVIGKFFFFNYCFTVVAFFLLSLLAFLVFKNGLAYTGTVSRFFVNLLCWLQLVVSPFFARFVPFRVEPSWLGACAGRPTTWMFGVAALLYAIAVAKRHQWVSSRLLGGTAIEPMQLTLAGGLSHQSIGDEAKEGAIQLV
jgi:hypothetical protein